MTLNSPKDCYEKRPRHTVYQGTHIRNNQINKLRGKTNGKETQ